LSDLLDKFAPWRDIQGEPGSSGRSRKESNMTVSGLYSKITENIEVSVTPIFLQDRSRPADNLYVWAYQVRIENKGSSTVTLRYRSEEHTSELQSREK